MRFGGVQKLALEHGLYLDKKTSFPTWEFPFYVNLKGVGKHPYNSFSLEDTKLFVFKKRDESAYRMEKDELDAWENLVSVKFERLCIALLFLFLIVNTLLLLTH
ncbi:hypothetical protein Hdeb2414_s0016g00481851 [Helianthus debilis subsp. tardiflorus]